MRAHPATLMLGTWAVAFLLLTLLPFNIVNRELSLFGYGMIALGLACFCIGALLRSPTVAVTRDVATVMPDFRRADIVFPAIALIAIAASVWELRSGAGTDLEALWQIRNERSGAFIQGTSSGSSLAFQIGFLLSPVAYTIIAREVIFRQDVVLWRLGVFGFGPLIGSALSLGGRGPLLFGITFATFAWLSRPKRASVKVKQPMRPRTVMLGIIAVLFSLAALNYFVTVFIIRAGEGGAQGMLDITGETWGVMFDGPTAEAMKATLGVGTTYLIFVFIWYFVQGIVISNVLFTSYDYAPQFGIYGIELITATARRIDSNFVALTYQSLDTINVVGFLPSAFGSLYVDLLYFSFPVVLLWGYLAGMVYERSRRSPDARWLLAAPIVIQGIIFSLLNTPVGLTNGLMSHFWLVLMFWMAKPARVALPAPPPRVLRTRFR